jgi:hypothetical protein
VKAPDSNAVLLPCLDVRDVLPVLGPARLIASQMISTTQLSEGTQPVLQTHSPTHGYSVSNQQK